jgi:hypothetical protein
MKDQKITVSEDYAYLKFSGPMIDGGKIDLVQAGKTLTSLGKWFKKYNKDFVNSEQKIVLRAGAIKEGSSEIQLFLDFLQTGHGQVAVTTIVASSIFKNLGVREFFQKFMGTLGEQLALKIFAKGKQPTERRKYVEKNKIFVELENSEGVLKNVPEEAWLIYKQTGPILNGFCNLEKGAEEDLRIGYHDSSKNIDKDIAKLNYTDKEYFQDINDPDELARRINEPFEEDKAIQMKIIGQFIDFYALAHRYHFSFQARREQDLHGKQKILCIVDTDQISKVIDYLKPENKKNVCIVGNGTKDKDGKTDKIKIRWVTEDLNYDPNQTKII